MIFIDPGPAYNTVPVKVFTDPARGDPDAFGVGVNPGTAAILFGLNDWGVCMTPTDSTSDGNVQMGTPIASGATEFTVSSLVLTNTTTGGAAGLRHLWGAETVSATDMRVALTGNVLFFQVGADGAFTNLNVDPPAVNVPVLVTCRLTTAGVRSIWYGASKVAERTDSGCTWGSNGANLGLGSSAYYNQRNWSGQINGGYVWSRALGDAEIVALASDFYVPIRPARLSPGIPYRVNHHLAYKAALLPAM